MSDPAFGVKMAAAKRKVCRGPLFVERQKVFLKRKPLFYADDVRFLLSGFQTAALFSNRVSNRNSIRNSIRPQTITRSASRKFSISTVSGAPPNSPSSVQGVSAAHSIVIRDVRMAVTSGDE